MYEEFYGFVQSPFTLAPEDPAARRLLDAAQGLISAVQRPSEV